MNENISLKNYPIEQVSVSNLKNYLTDRGWNQEQFGREEVLKFRSPQPIQGQEYFDILIPSKRELVDYERIVKIAIESISFFEKRSFEDVLTQVLSFGDLLKFRISTLTTKMGNIPITDGIGLYQSINDFLIYSACAELSPQKSFPRRYKEAVSLIKSYQIGQSQYGSYIANIQCRLQRPRTRDLDLEMNSIPLEPPLGRKTIVRILNGLENVNQSVKEESSDPIVNHYHEGLNANMCDALVDIIEIGLGNAIDISANLEPIWAIQDNIHTNFMLQPSSKGYLIEASEILKGENPEERITLKGYVFQLKRIPTEEDNTIRMLIFDEEGETKPVDVKLNDESYRLAIDAHRDSHQIQITGILKKAGRKWYLNNPENLEIFDETQ
ncbi:MAG: hypothetical protein KKI06_14505 [Euryarchaeota archaeon]|nr:hypothetical protein [Euryarchaeota archaeon]